MGVTNCGIDVEASFRVKLINQFYDISFIKIPKTLKIKLFIEKLERNHHSVNL